MKKRHPVLRKRRGSGFTGGVSLVRDAFPGPPACLPGHLPPCCLSRYYIRLVGLKGKPDCAFRVLRLPSAFGPPRSFLFPFFCTPSLLTSLPYPLVSSFTSSFIASLRRTAVLPSVSFTLPDLYYAVFFNLPFYLISSVLSPNRNDLPSECLPVLHLSVFCRGVQTFLGPESSYLTAPLSLDGYVRFFIWEPHKNKRMTSCVFSNKFPIRSPLILCPRYPGITGSGHYGMNTVKSPADGAFRTFGTGFEGNVGNWPENIPEEGNI